jgi:hypothetical protein
MEAGVLLEPLVDVGVLVGAVVIDNQVQVHLGGELAVEDAQELQGWMRCAVLIDATTLGATDPALLLARASERPREGRAHARIGRRVSHKPLKPSLESF